MNARRYYCEDRTVLCGMDYVASAASLRLAKRIANALNRYHPKVRRQKSAEKAVSSRP